VAEICPSNKLLLLSRPLACPGLGDTAIEFAEAMHDETTCSNSMRCDCPTSADPKRVVFSFISLAFFRGSANIVRVLEMELRLEDKE